MDQITSCRCPECFDIRDAFAHFAVRDVPSDLVDERNAAMSLMAPIAWRYFLPRFIEFSIVPTFADSFVIDVVLYQLGPENPEEPYWAERHVMFNDAERRVVANYIATRKTWPDEYNGGFHDQFFDRAEIIWGTGVIVA
jgi:hypothetical protein